MTHRTLIHVRSLCAIVFGILAVQIDWAAAFVAYLAVWMWWEARR